MDYEDAIADRIRIWLCTFTLATCYGACLLLPMSIIGSEVIRVAPENFYWKWLNPSLLHFLWNSIFLFSNLSLFVFLPFAHLFFDSVGLPGSSKGIRSRFTETLIAMCAITIATLGISFVVSAIFDYDNARTQSVFNLRDYYLPFMYSCISFFGVIVLLLCTPLGFARLFTVVSNLVLKSTFRVDFKDELEAAELQRKSIERRIGDLEEKRNEANHAETEGCLSKQKQELEQVELQIRQYEKQSKRSNLYRNLCYPLIMVVLLVLNAFGVLIVVKNIIYVILGHLPTIKNSHEIFYKQEVKHGAVFFSFGILELFFEIVLILYFTVASLVGFYSIPVFRKILPKYKSTPTDKIIINCGIFLVFSSALPVSSKILGLTRFDLLGHYGDLNWLSSAKVILVYNFAFALATGLFIFNRFTSSVRAELYNKILVLLHDSKTSNHHT